MIARARNTSLALAALLALLALTGCGDDDSSEPPTSPEPEVEAPPSATADGEPPSDAAEEPPPAQDKPSGPAESGTEDPRLTALERRAIRTVRAFVAALDARDGERACALLAPDALDEVELPTERGSCAASLGASIGYRDPRGLPVWEGARVTEVRSVELDGESAKVVATVITRFADREEVSIEDDVVYLSRAGAGWVIAKPSSTLYRAIGVGDVPPSVLAPP